MALLSPHERRLAELRSDVRVALEALEEAERQHDERLREWEIAEERLRTASSKKEGAA